ncbi:type II toxin-antitoxin system RelE family toxin [Limnofasciculus baicalensis]|uniref:Type II toxin-antitoxin system RelE/ParE family toxin n=1 Tax=Limnofasciculus baicalensis BBK-W-15 TaxID=2699891 RepID=A0AAE3KS67_9CYAN|nr:type II toxin-antitoxin system RelE/ParE family toxin [Limnofasciculus baicalensis]MCP2732358.1 type II toxin-antitoxin system RelE/ParE family toxin [Limnofasciculus baicalensis BBK-W-15]
MPYVIGFKPSALRQLRKLDRENQTLLIAAIESLSENPRPDGCKKLKGQTNLYRIRVARIYRIVYEVKDKQLVITILKVGNRRDIYRQ